MARIRHSQRMAVRWDVAGSAVDVGRYLTGEPECMLDFRRTRRPSPVVRIGVERAVDWSVPPDKIEAVGASVLFVVESLRTAGVPAEIDALFTVRSAKGDTMQTRVRVQDAGRPLDVDRLAYWLAHPTALRRIAFGIWEHERTGIRNLFGFVRDGGYGYPASGFVPDDAPKYDEVAPAYADNATAWVREVLSRRIGVEIEESE